MEPSSGPSIGSRRRLIASAPATRSDLGQQLARVQLALCGRSGKARTLARKRTRNRSVNHRIAYHATLSSGRYSACRTGRMTDARTGLNERRVARPGRCFALPVTAIAWGSRRTASGLSRPTCSGGRPAVQAGRRAARESARSRCSRLRGVSSLLDVGHVPNFARVRLPRREKPERAPWLDRRAETRRGRRP